MNINPVIASAAKQSSVLRDGLPRRPSPLRYAGRLAMTLESVDE